MPLGLVLLAMCLSLIPLVSMPASAHDDTNSSSDYDGMLRIPFSQMRFDVGDAETAIWGLNVSRHEPRFQ